MTDQSSKLKYQKLKIKISIQSSIKVFKNPFYVGLAMLSGVLMGLVIVWVLNFDLLLYILLESPLKFNEKLKFLVDGYTQIFTSFDSLLSVGIMLFTVLFGINFALLVFVIKHNGFKNIPKKSGLFASVLAIIGGGCIACGTSLISPLLVTIGATSVPLVQDISTIFNWIGSALLAYSIYSLGKIISVILTHKSI